MKTEITEAIVEYVIQNYEHQMINCAEFIGNITTLQEDIKKFNLSEKQIRLVNCY